MWLQAIAAAFDVPGSVVERVTQAPRQRAQAAMARQRAKLEGKGIFFFPDSQLEIPLARFAQRELGMRLLEVGTPYLHKGLMGPELALLPDGVSLSEGRTWTGNWTAARHCNPTWWCAAWAWPIR